jgi:NadR type nicotinamide-nucleotide adenylyltransferase
MNVRKIAILGSESTGKSTLCQDLATYYNATGIPEYARNYVEELSRSYTYEDVEKIAFVQRQQLYAEYKTTMVFFDTELIITKVWFDVVFNKCPEWIESAIQNAPIDFYLLCDTDLDWIPDDVRENGGEFRYQLQKMYTKILDQYGFVYGVVTGKGEQRLKNAVNHIENNRLIGKK